MGQYYLIVNLDKRQYLKPSKFYDGLKLLEFGDSRSGTMTALAILLADGNGRGGGDLRTTNPIVGTWAGDRIVVAGDYADEGKWVSDEDRSEFIRSLETKKELEDYADKAPTLHAVAWATYKDISKDVAVAMMDDASLKRDLTPKLKEAAKTDKMIRKMKYETNPRRRKKGTATYEGNKLLAQITLRDKEDL